MKLWQPINVIRNAVHQSGLWPDAGISNPCLSALPRELALDERLQVIWEGLDPEQVWDTHAHLIGTGDSGSGIRLHRDMANPFKPLSYIQRAFYLNASCCNEPGRIDTAFVERLLALHDQMPRGYKTMLLAFDDCYDEHGRHSGHLSAFVTPNAYAQQLARDYPHRFEWIASIHPYRHDCLEELERAIAGGAKAIKWLPQAQGINPASPLCDRFYAALARYNLPLLTHAGSEKAVHGACREDYGNPLLLRSPLDQGVRVIIAHCASLGRYPDLDARGKTPRDAFDLFARLMDDPAYERSLFADISAITQTNRAGRPLRVIMGRDDWHPRLLNGTDYPLPGVMPLFSPSKLAANGYLHADVVPFLNRLRRHNPLLFDFALKRLLQWQGKRLSKNIFETRNVFEGRQSQTCECPAHSQSETAAIR